MVLGRQIERHNDPIMLVIFDQGGERAAWLALPKTWAILRRVRKTPMGILTR